ncbi:hypothetical protein E2C01_080418 [Portunus trituberculatus]|uniref:Uncharacterized protein n=1 Tax=Portunus trituberculatus TaxID=210409 RepID=A0A5B7IVD1_PORTR|nr:hypothetical protein [Portunus trituberculatus]
MLSGHLQGPKKQVYDLPRTQRHTPAGLAQSSHTRYTCCCTHLQRKKRINSLKKRFGAFMYTTTIVFRRQCERVHLERHWRKADAHFC